MIDMLTLIFIILLLSVVGSMVGLAFKAAWGITKVVFSVILLPVALIAMVICGLLPLALMILVIMAIVSFIGRLAVA